MIVGIGSDLVEIARIADAIGRFDRRFLERCFSPAERAYADALPNAGLRACAYAKRWAAKEAVAKALGLGIARGVYLRDIQVIRQGTGQPGIELSGGARERLARLTPDKMTPVVHVSLSDDAAMAMAFIVIDAI